MIDNGWPALKPRGYNFCFVEKFLHYLDYESIKILRPVVGRASSVISEFNHALKTATFLRFSIISALSWLILIIEELKS